MKRVLFFTSVILLVLLALSMPFVEVGSGAFVVSVLSLVFILLTLLGLFILSRLDWDPFDELW
ncbi:hypothetical protein ACNS7O_08740 [Haloferacaceae archaeon DSL9]